MATQRTLKLNLLADVDKFGAGLDKAGKDAQGFGNKVKKYGKIAAGALAAVGAAAGAMAIKLGVDAVQGAVEDELSQKKLATALRNTTKATDEQIASTEQYISRQQLAFGIADTKLRPALATLARATGDVTEAQKLNNLAIDISAATGKDLESVSLGLAKAYNGNIGALTRLGIPLDENIIKTKDFDAAAGELTRLFGGSAQENTKTLAGQLAILRETFGELQEGVGVKFIPVLKNLLDNVLKVARAFSGEDPEGLSARARELKGEVGDGGAGGLGRSIAILADAFGNLFKEFSEDGDKTTSTMQEMANALISIANGINAVANAFKNYKKFYEQIPEGLRNFMNPIARLSGYADFFGGGRAAGGSVMAGQAVRVGEFGSEVFIPSGSGSIRPDRGGSGGNTFILNGIIDAESARRSIEQLLQNSARRTGAVNFVGANL
jgi:uncharacterized protein YukE